MSFLSASRLSEAWWVTLSLYNIVGKLFEDEFCILIRKISSLRAILTSYYVNFNISYLLRFQNCKKNPQKVLKVFQFIHMTYTAVFVCVNKPRSPYLVLMMRRNFRFLPYQTNEIILWSWLRGVNDWVYLRLKLRDFGQNKVSKSLKND